MRFTFAFYLNLLMVMHVMSGMEWSFENHYFKLLPTGGASVYSDGKTILMKVVSHNEGGKGAYPENKQKEFINFILKKKKKDINQLGQMASSLGKTALWYAAETGNNEGVQILVENGATDSEKHPAIAAAIMGWKKRKQMRSVRENEIDQSYLGIVTFLVNSGFSIDKTEVGALLPLLVAIQYHLMLPGVSELLLWRTDYHKTYFQLKEVNHQTIIKNHFISLIFKENKTYLSEITNYLSLLVPDLQRLVLDYYFFENPVQPTQN